MAKVYVQARGESREGQWSALISGMTRTEIPQEGDRIGPLFQVGPRSEAQGFIFEDGRRGWIEFRREHGFTQTCWWLPG